MKILYVIPARAGSKGLPEKNVKILGKKPLIEYSIDFALANMFEGDELCISTNDPKVIEIAKSKGVSVPFIRPDALASDDSSTNDVLIHALSYYESIDKKFDAILLLQPTSPFRSQEDFTQLLSEITSEIDMVVSVKVAKENPYFTLFEEDNGGYLQKSKNGGFIRRQDCPPVYAFNGSMYLISIGALKNHKIGEFKRFFLLK
jgi:N-acylneuraminate cytidylyltransferase